MPSPNSFYRFQPAWNAGFYPDNQITSNLLNELAVTVDAWLPSFFPGKTLSQLVAGVRGQMESFNVSPYFGGFTLTYQTIPDIPNYEYNINIRNADLAETDNSQVVVVNGFFNNTTKEVLSASVITFTAGSYSGTFDFSSIPVETEVDRALQIVEQNGSAFFPMTYSYDATSGIATSGLARGKNWQLDSSGNPVRLPADTLPKQNARTFNVAAQTAEDRYCISLMEKVINFSLSETDETLIQAYFNTFTVPDGWTASFTIVSGTYTRVFCLLYRDDRSLLMIGRLDTNWLWQRFINEIDSSDTTYFNSYASTTPLPYTPLSSFQWLYGDWYDMEFVEFTDGCYVSPEFYAMPAIPGDNWQFNVPSDEGNLTGLTSANVGLFSESGQFIQQIGDAGQSEYICCTPYQAFYSNNLESGWDDILTQCNLYADDPATHKIGVIIFDSSNPTLKREFWYDITAAFANKNELLDALVTLSDPSNTFTKETDGVNYVLFYDPIGYPCTNSENLTVYIQLSEIPTFLIEGWEMDLTGGFINQFTNDFYSNALIPAVASGCYRLGLYDEIEGNFYLYSLSNIINIDSADCFSTMLEFWANDNSIAQGFEYFNGWKQRVRLGLNGGGAKPVIEENLYRQSNGVHRRPQNKQDLSLDLHTDFIDEQTQLALVDATRHPYLVWNNKSIFVKGDIDVATIQDFTTQSSFETLAQVKFSALVQGFQPKNSSCLTC
jgi:hypothetical protein